MKRDEFQELVNGIGYNEEQVAACLRGVELLEAFLSDLPQPIALEDATADHVPPFMASLIANEQNERNYVVGIYYYAGMIKNYRLQVGVLELIDGFEIMGNYHQAVGDVLGEALQAEVFVGLDLPALGTRTTDWMEWNAVVFPRLQAVASPDDVRRILQSGLRNLPDEYYLPAKERFESFSTIEEFLEDRGQRHLDNLIKQREDGTPYFNQFISDDVIEFVRATPEIGRGVRQGNTIIEIKIPHETIEYLAADALREKQYRVCHCPLVKESIPRDDVSIDPAFCDFCPSFNARPWEVIFGQKLDYEVMESGLRGGKWCKFAIHLPEDKL